MRTTPRKIFGPGLLVTAAFIGPGTVTTASRAGATFGFAVAWALVFAIIATVVLQEMAARLGLVARLGLGEALRETFVKPPLRALAIALVVAAIAVGNAAFEMGNITGAGIGLEELTGVSHKVWAAVVGIGAAVILAVGVYRVLERILIVLVALMSLVFILTAVFAQPDMGSVATGAFVPTLPPGSLVTVIALIGTTVVPYNLFLHASAVQEKWPQSLPTREALSAARVDTALSVALGGLVTLAILVTAATCYPLGTNLEAVGAMARQLEPLLGRTARVFFATGLLAAGLTSAVTAPLAAAYATSGALGWNAGLRSWRFRGIWLAIILVGTVLAIRGERPVAAIEFAQAANGLLLPIVAVFLLVVVNQRKLLGKHVNGPVANLFGALVVLVAAGLGVCNVANALGFAIV